MPRYWGWRTVQDRTGLRGVELDGGWVSMLGMRAGVLMVIWCAYLCPSPVVLGREWKLWTTPHIRSLSVLLRGWKGQGSCFFCRGLQWGSSGKPGWSPRRISCLMPEFGVLVSFMFDRLGAEHRINFRTLGLCLVVEDMAHATSVLVAGWGTSWEKILGQLFVSLTMMLEGLPMCLCVGCEVTMIPTFCPMFGSHINSKELSSRLLIRGCARQIGLYQMSWRVDGLWKQGPWQIFLLTEQKLAWKMLWKSIPHTSVYNNYLNCLSIKRKETKLNKKYLEHMTLNFTVEEIQMVILHMKRHPTSLMVRGKQINANVIFFFLLYWKFKGTLQRLVKISGNKPLDVLLGVYMVNILFKTVCSSISSSGSGL